METILVAEDSPTQVVQIRGLLEAAGFEVKSVNNGAEALAAMSEQVFAAVLTDLNMPQVGGLELVVAARRDFPRVPVVLMTAFGSEEIAVRALQSGAASYVPKRNLAPDLVDTLRDVIDVARCDREDARLGQFLTDVEAHFQLLSAAPPILAVMDFVQQGMTQLRLGDETDRVRVSVALDTAVHNVLHFGNLELTPEEMNESYKRDETGQSYYRLLEERARQPPYVDRQIHVFVKINSNEVRSTVRHEGPSVDVKRIFDGADAQELDGHQARGWLLVHSFMDEVTANDAGTEITLVRRFNS